VESLLLDVKESSNYLNIKEKTIYAIIKLNEIPHYRIGRLIRIDKTELDAWLATKKKALSTNKPIKRRKLKEDLTLPGHIDKIIRNTIDQVKDEVYNPPYGKPDYIEGLEGKEVKYGAL
jgi:excisionase family DNA binding protein